MATIRIFVLAASTAVLGCGNVDPPASTSDESASRERTSQAPGQQGRRDAGAPEIDSYHTSVIVERKRTNPGADDADWLQFRGPAGNGVSTATGLPVKWSATENMLWKRRLPGAGASSPIGVGARIYVTCYSGYGLSKTNPGEPKNLTRHLVCLDAKTGGVHWNKSVTHDRLDHGYTNFMQLHGYASSTPVSDGEHVYAYFGNWGLYAFDLDGKQLWRIDCGPGAHSFGSGASPVLHGKLVIVNATVEGHVLIAVDKTTGKEVWRSERITDSWSTPAVVRAGGRDEIVLPTRQGIHAFDAKSGKTLWKWIGDKGSTYTCPSLVHDNGILYGLSSYHGPVAAIRAGGNGDVSDSHAVWTSPHFRTTVTSPVLTRGRLYYAHDEGGYVACIDAKSGKEIKRIRARPAFGRLYASPLAAGGKIYIVTRTRGAYVFKAGPKIEQVAVNRISGDDSVFNASPVVHRDRLLLRSDKNLYCIGR